VTTPSPAVCRVMAGRAIRAARLAADVPREKIAQALGNAVNRVSRIEQGHGTLSVDEVEKILALLKPSTEDADRIRLLAAQARKRGSFGKVPNWARQFLGLETEASSLKIWQEVLIPGPLQTEAYATAVVATSPVVATADVTSTVEARMRRRELLTRANPPEIHIVLGEAALRQVIGGPDVHREQIERLIEVAQYSHLTLQILPFSAGEHAALGTSFELLELDLEDNYATYVYLEDLTNADCRDGDSHVRAYKLIFDRLRVNALGERETLATLERALH
jgi:transcriptional regulator with XRE-family HTH domain